MATSIYVISTQGVSTKTVVTGSGAPVLAAGATLTGNTTMDVAVLKTNSFSASSGGACLGSDVSGNFKFSTAGSTNVATLVPGASSSAVITLPATTGTLALTTAITGGSTAASFTTLAASGAATFTSAAPQLTVGVLNTTLGAIKFFGSSSGNITLQPTAGAGSSLTITMPAATGTMALTSDITGGTLAGSFTTLGASGAITDTQALAANSAGDGVIIQNTTAASSGNQRYSPALRLTGQGWKTTATAASQAADFRLYVVPIQGTSAPVGKLVMDAQINGGGYTDLFHFFDSFIGINISKQNLAVGNGGVIGFTNNSNGTFTRTNFASSGDGVLQIRIGTGGTGASLDIATADTVKIRNLAANADGTLTAGNITASGTLAVTGVTTATGGVTYGTYTVGTFPTTTYLEAVVTDSLAPVVGAAVSAGGSAKCVVMYNGSAKIVTAVL